MKSVVWVLVNTNNGKEAEKIGRAVLKNRLCACFGIIPKTKSVYFWPASRRLTISFNDASRGGPPKSNKLETSYGPLLVLETLSKNYQALCRLVKKIHSDQVPFIGQLKIENVDPAFHSWLRGELG